MPTIQKNNKTVLGIIGGMGPLATVELQRLIIEHTIAKHDQDHIEVIVHNNPHIPDRTQSLFENDGHDYVREVVLSGKKLIDTGATLLCMPCITAHARFDLIQKSLKKPVINMVNLVTEYVTKNTISGPIGVLATQGTIREKIFEKSFSDKSISFLVPDFAEQQKIMTSIYAIKAGRKSECTPILHNIIQKLQAQGAASILLGCTELGLCEDELKERNIQIINPLRILAEDIATNQR